MGNLSFVNVFANDVVAQYEFYRDVFGFPEVEEYRSPIFRALAAGSANIGFNAFDTYEVLNLSDHADSRGVRFMLNIEVDSMEEVERLTKKALERGATILKAPYKTYYNWYQAVLFDPEKNVFRISKIMGT